MASVHQLTDFWKASLKEKVKMTLRFAISLLRTLASLLFVLMFSKRASCSRGSKKDKSIVVLGNGPSLRNDIDQLVERIDDSLFDICAVNDFALSDEFFKVRPCVYVLADPNYWQSGVDEALDERRRRLMQILVSEVDWPIKLMLPREAQRSLISIASASNFLTVEYYNRTPVDGFDWVSFRLFNSGAGMPPPYNVLIAALKLAISDRYRNVFILGADHSWHEEISFACDSGVLVAQRHFYDEKVDLKPVYKAPQDSFTIGELFVRWGKVFKAYEVLSSYAKYNRVNIYNLSSKSYIDAFPRAGLKELDAL